MTSRFNFRTLIINMIPDLSFSALPPFESSSSFTFAICVYSHLSFLFLFILHKVTLVAIHLMQSGPSPLRLTNSALLVIGAVMRTGTLLSNKLNLLFEAFPGRLIIETVGFQFNKDLRSNSLNTYISYCRMIVKLPIARIKNKIISTQNRITRKLNNTFSTALAS